MMIHFQKFSPKGMVVIQKGIIPFEETCSLCEAFNEHPDFMDFRYQLFIYDKVEDFTMSVSDVMHLAQLDTRASIKNPHIKVAIVCDSPLIYGVGRMYDAYAADSQWETEVFYTLNEALDFLNLDRQDLDIPGL